MKFFENIKNGKLIRAGILIVLAVSPLPFGSVQTGVFLTIELFILLLFLLWILKVWLNKAERRERGGDEITREFYDSHGTREGRNDHGGREENGEGLGIERGREEGDSIGRHHHRRRSRFGVNPLYMVLGMIVLLILFQLMPLPPAILNFFSPNSYLMHDAELSDIKNIAGMVTEGREEAGRLGSWEARKLGSWEAGRLGGEEAGRLGGLEAGKSERRDGEAGRRGRRH